MANIEIRQKAKQKRIAQWEIADVLGIHESKFARMLRHELDPEDKERVLAAIEQISKKEE